MILADTSAWVEYLRATGSPAHLRLRELIAGEGELATTEVVTMELLAGVASPEEVTRLRRLLLRVQLLPVEGLADYEAAAALYRHCRARRSASMPDRTPAVRKAGAFYLPDSRRSRAP